MNRASSLSKHSQSEVVHQEKWEILKHLKSFHWQCTRHLFLPQQNPVPRWALIPRTDRQDLPPYVNDLVSEMRPWSWSGASQEWVNIRLGRKCASIKRGWCLCVNLRAFTAGSFGCEVHGTLACEKAAAEWQNIWQPIIEVPGSHIIISSRTPMLSERMIFMPTVRYTMSTVAIEWYNSEGGL